MSTVTRDSTYPPKADYHQCQLTDAGGRCPGQATVWIFNLDSNAGEATDLRACGKHTDRAFQEVGGRGGTCTPEFRVIPLGSLAERIRVLVPVGPYLA